MKAGRVFHAAHGDHAVAVTLQAVTRRAENLVAVLAALEKLPIYGRGKAFESLGT
jgi:hypothetical protein